MRRLPWRLKFLFGLCQLWYPFFAAAAVMMYLAPALALLLDVRFVDVTYPAFLGHSIPAGLILTAVAILLKRDGLLRPVDAPVLSWEKALFMALQWPWVVWGCTMAVRDRLTGRFVDFRITPKGEAASRRIPPRIFALYLGLALGCILPVFLSDHLDQAPGFLLLALINALIYGAVMAVMVWQHLRHAVNDWQGQARDLAVQGLALAGVFGLVAVGGISRGAESLHALSFGFGPLELTRAEFEVSGAGRGGTFSVRFRIAPSWTIHAPKGS